MEAVFDLQGQDDCKLAANFFFTLKLTILNCVTLCQYCLASCLLMLLLHVWLKPD